MQCSVLRSFAVMGENKNDDKMVLSVFIGYTHTHTHTLYTLCAGCKMGTSGLTSVCLWLDWSHRFWPTRTQW